MTCVYARRVRVCGVCARRVCARGAAAVDVVSSVFYMRSDVYMRGVYVCVARQLSTSSVGDLKTALNMKAVYCIVQLYIVLLEITNCAARVCARGAAAVDVVGRGLEDGVYAYVSCVCARGAAAVDVVGRGLQDGAAGRAGPALGPAV